MPVKVEVVGPLSGGWFAIAEDGVVSQARFPDQSAGWIAWRDYSMGRAGGTSAGIVPKARRHRR